MPTYMTAEQARCLEWPGIEIGHRYYFYSELVEEEASPEERNRNYTGQEVTVIRPLRDRTHDGPEEEIESDWFPTGYNGWGEPEVSRGYMVRADNGHEFCALEEELNGWDHALGQYCGPSGIWGRED